MMDLHWALEPPVRGFSGRAMKDYLDLTELRRPADRGQHHLMGWGRMNRKEKVNCFASTGFQGLLLSPLCHDGLYPATINQRKPNLP